MTKQLSIEELIYIGFCQQKFYKRSAWQKAAKVMNSLCETGYVKPFDYGRGKGKYATTKKLDDLNLGSLKNIASFLSQFIKNS